MPWVNPEDRRRYCRERYRTDSKYRAKALKRSEKRRTNPEQRARYLEYRRQWRQRPENKLKETVYRNAYRKSNQAYFNEAGGRYRALVRSSQVEKVDYSLVIRRAKGKCGICKKRLTLPVEVDHIIPISKGGPHTYANLQAAHASCNRKKWAKAA